MFHYRLLVKFDRPTCRNLQRPVPDFSRVGGCGRRPPTLEKNQGGDPGNFSRGRRTFSGNSLSMSMVSNLCARYSGTVLQCC